MLIVGIRGVLRDDQGGWIDGFSIRVKSYSKGGYVELGDSDKPCLQGGQSRNELLSEMSYEIPT